MRQCAGTCIALCPSVGRKKNTSSSTACVSFQLAAAIRSSLVSGPARTTNHFAQPSRNAVITDNRTHAERLRTMHGRVRCFELPSHATRHSDRHVPEQRGQAISHTCVAIACVACGPAIACVRAADLHYSVFGVYGSDCDTHSVSQCSRL